MSKLSYDTLHMVGTHCPICMNGPKIDCSDMQRCPLALAKFKGEILTPEEFASLHGIKHSPLAVETQPPPADQGGQFSLF